MSPLPRFSDADLEALCNVLGETSGGFTGGEIGGLLSQLGFADPLAGVTKRHRLFAALKARQEQDSCGNPVVQFVLEAMQPVRYMGRGEMHESRRSQLNCVLAFSGLYLDEANQLVRAGPVRTLSEAERVAGRLRAELERRGVHQDVLKFCRAELVQENYFHAVLEATKSVAEKLRNKSGLTSDGHALIDQVLSFGKLGESPLLAFNSLQTESECSEQKGLVNLAKGLFGAFRNVPAHVPKILWQMSEQDALDCFAIASLLHRKLDGCTHKIPTSLSDPLAG